MRPFSYTKARDDADAVQAARSSGAVLLAGGTTVLDLAKLDVMQPERLIDINGLGSRHGNIRADASGLHLGALVRMSQAEAHPAILADYPVIAQSLHLAASAQIRNMASLGGNVLQRTRCTYFRDPTWTACNKRTPGSGCAAMEGVNHRMAVLGVSDQCIAAYPGDFAQALIALDATVEIVGAKGARVIPFADLHRAPGQTPQIETNLEPGDMIIGFHVPAAAFTRRSLYLKVRDRQSYEFANASAAVALDLREGVVRGARIALGAVATKPWRSHAAEAVLTGKPLDPATAKLAAEAAFAGAVTHGENHTKPELGRRTLARALLQAAAMKA